MTAPLPDTIPVFPLPGVLLLPQGELPLKIFEPRYVNLLLDCLGEGRLMGLIQTRRDESHPVPEGAPVYPVGCLGRVSAFMETQDGAFLITLTGINRFTVVAESEPCRGYRRMRVAYGDFSEDTMPDLPFPIDRARLLDTAGAYLRPRGLEADWEALKRAPDSLLVTSLAMACPLEAREKQALLECSLAERAELLLALLEMGARARPDPDTPAVRH
ncbi:MAG: LON peptidase substrate-binding domain-containing protein [Magnetospirillum sp. WYHS-4]